MPGDKMMETSREKICHVSASKSSRSGVILSTKSSEYKSLCIKSESKNVFLSTVSLGSFEEVENCLMDRKNKKNIPIIFLSKEAWKRKRHKLAMVLLFFFMETPFNKRLIDWCCKWLTQRRQQWKSYEMLFVQ